MCHKRQATTIRTPTSSFVDTLPVSSSSVWSQKSQVAKILPRSRNNNTNNNNNNNSVRLVSSALKCLLIVGSSHDQALALASFLVLLVGINQAASVACQEVRSAPVGNASSEPTGVFEQLAGVNESAGFALVPVAFPDGATGAQSAPKASLDYYPKQQQQQQQVAASNSSEHLSKAALNNQHQGRQQAGSRRPRQQPPSYRQVHVPRPLLAGGWRHHQHQHQHQHRNHNNANQNHNQQAARQLKAGRLYKRVLLCDKTLVSLDYADGNNYEPDLRLAADTSSQVAGADGEPLERLSSVDLLRRVSNMSALGRASLSADNDAALIRCDMWDLEKGLKSRKPPLSVLRLAVKADFATVRGAINRCRRLSESRLPADDGYRDEPDILTADDMFSLFNIKRGLIPGTKWCGLGDIASSYNDLGAKHRIDICCRAHDHCPTRLKPFRNDYGVLNIALYTKSHCDCDADFYRCLRSLNSKTADMLGNLYFNVMKLQCLREEKAKVCRKIMPIALGMGRCVRYDVDHSRSMFKFTTPPVAY